MWARTVLLGFVASCASSKPVASPASATVGGSVAGIVRVEAEPGFFLDAPPNLAAPALTGIEVVATSHALAKPRRTVTDERGYYTLTGLPPGTYQITFRHHTNAQVQRDDVAVGEASTTPVFVRLNIATAIKPVCVYYGTCSM